MSAQPEPNAEPNEVETRELRFELDRAVRERQEKDGAHVEARKRLRQLEAGRMLRTDPLAPVVVDAIDFELAKEQAKEEDDRTLREAAAARQRERAARLALAQRELAELGPDYARVRSEAEAKLAAADRAIAKAIAAYWEAADAMAVELDAARGMLKAATDAAADDDTRDRMRFAARGGDLAVALDDEGRPAETVGRPTWDSVLGWDVAAEAARQPQERRRLLPTKLVATIEKVSGRKQR